MSLSLSITILLTALWAAVTTLGIVLLMIGLRGRRADFLPRCGSCRYVIKGGFDPTRCSECGADLAQAGMVRLGRRRMNEAPLVFGLLLSMFGISAVVFAITRNTPAVAAAVVAPIPGGPPKAAPVVTTTAGTRFVAQFPDAMSSPSASDTSNTDSVAHAGLLDWAALMAQSHAGEVERAPIAPDELQTPSIGSVDAGSDTDRSRGAGSEPPGSDAASTLNTSLLSVSPEFATLGWKTDETGVFSVDVAPLEFEPAPLVTNVLRSHRTVFTPAPAGLAASWTSAAKHEPQPVETRVRSTAVRPTRVGRNRR